MSKEIKFMLLGYMKSPKATKEEKASIKSLIEFTTKVQESGGSYSKEDNSFNPSRKTTYPRPTQG